MNALSNLKTGTRLISGFLMVAAVTVIVGMVGLFYINNLGEHIKDIGGNNLPSVLALLTINEAQTAVDSAENALLCRSVLMDDKLVQEQRARIKSAFKRADDAWMAYEPLTRIPEEDLLWKQFVPAWETWKSDNQAFLRLCDDYLKDSAAAVQAGNAGIETPAAENAAAEKVAAGTPAAEKAAAGTALYDKMVKQAIMEDNGSFKSAESLLLQLVETNNKDVKTHLLAAQADANRAKTILRGTIALGVLLAMILGILITISITRPLSLAVQMIQNLGNGDFSRRLEINQRDEIGIMAKALNLVVENLQGQIKEIRDAANVLASSSSEISASVTQVTSGAQETATAVTETTATVEEVKQTAHLTSQKSKAVADSSQQGVQLAHTGRKSMESVADGMKRINEQMASIADTIVRLGEQSQAIGEITATVDDIAEQSNLLAVNAAVEAAKAGEHGKGFAVVAQEIKALAEQSKQATRQVRAILNDIQKATGAAVMATERGSKAVEQGMRESLGASESIQILTASFAETAQAGGLIAASTQEQLTGMDQVAQAMESIKEASQQNVASMRQLEEAAQILKDVGHKFTTLVGRYKV